ncbi:GntR family transcriptional regulator [Bradyrhizobium oligotrophicum]|uniref:GntR family transcriptional regulator n=1 Tax=Bradyrhizobium oligotrophicum TaxID=44255 RepID=UPI003EB7BCEB
MVRRKSVRETAKPETEDAQRRGGGNLFEAAYLKIEELLVNCALQPGRFLTVQELQDITGFGRTPVHAAVNGLAADTLIIIRPRHGLQIAPIDLARERLLLALRRDMERFVVRLAAERASLSHRSQMQQIERVLSERRTSLSIDEFNQFDRRIDALILAASGEAFLVHTMRPLHTIYRRIGYIYHRLLPDHDLTGTVDRHIAILNAVAGQRVGAAVKASDTLIDFMDQMFVDLEAGIDPRLLDCNIEPLPLAQVSKTSTRKD